MAVVRWEPTRELENFQSDMNRLFESVFRPESGRDGPRWAPPTDLSQEGDDLVLRLDLPGMDDDSVDVEVEGNVLTVSGERSEEREVKEGGRLRRERSFGKFARSFTLPEGTEPDSIKGDFDKGVLEIRVPKPAEERPRKVRIGTGSSSDQRVIEGSSKEE